LATLRTFVALPLPDPWEGYLAGVTRSLAGVVTGVGWTKPSSLHLTLRFLGDLEAADVERLGDAVARGAEGAVAVTAEVGSFGAFPRIDRPRVLWVGIGSGEREILALADRVNGAVDASGFPPADKPFRPHVTLGRVREGARGLDALRGFALPPRPPAATLDRILVMKSDLHPTGARYTAIREVRLPPL
jgi:2'-5' RNA ligase